jgi:citrate synthase
MSDRVKADGEPDLDTSQWITAEEAANRLRVKRETIYAYVSRGRLASRRSDDGRGRVLDPADVDRLAFRSRSARKSAPEGIESAITLIQDGSVFYRGRPAAELATSWTFERVADHLWGAGSQPTQAWEPSSAVVDIYQRVAAVLPSTALPVDMLRIAGACMAAFDPPEPALTPQILVATTKRFIATVLHAVPALSELEDIPKGGPRLAALLWSRLNPRPPSANELSMLNSAMIMLADHDVARSTVSIRIAARAGLDAGGLIRLGMDSEGGPVKGVASLAIESFLHNLTSSDAVDVALMRRLKQGEPVPGFGHPVYPDHDPRADLILDWLRRAAQDRARLATVDEVIRNQLSRGLQPPNAGFALAAMTYVTGMVPGAGETIFVMSRSAGWIAHAIEVLELGPLERGHSTYTGSVPNPSSAR